MCAARFVKVVTTQVCFERSFQVCFQITNLLQASLLPEGTNDDPGVDTFFHERFALLEKLPGQDDDACCSVANLSILVQGWRVELDIKELYSLEPNDG